MSFKAAVLQINSQPDVQENLNAITPLLERAASDGARLALLPENFAFYGYPKRRLAESQEIFKTARSYLQQKAAEYNIYLLGGGFPEPCEGSEGTRMYNRAELFAPDGKSLAIYRKIHLFDVAVDEGTTYRESDTVNSGALTPIVAGTQELGNIGLSICYDIRFPKLYHGLSEKGAQIITIPAAFTERTGMAHWEPLLRARAIENQCYVLAAAQTGQHGPKMRTYGHAMIIDPWGEVRANAGTETGYALAEVDLDYLQDIRTRLPSLTHRQL